MTLKMFLQKQAKRYPELSFEMRIIVAPFLSLLFFLYEAKEAIVLKTRKVKSSSSLTFKKIRTFAHSFLSFSSLKKSVKRRFPFFKKKKGIIFQQKKLSSAKRKKKILNDAPRVPLGYKLRYFFIGTFFSFFFIFLPLLIVVFLQDLPHPKELTLRQIPQTTKIYDRNKKLLYQIYASQNRTLIPLSSVPTHLQQATLAIEDKNFYKHPGFDISSIIRAAKENVSGGTFQGGSTITQQLIKSSMLTPEPSVVRKVKEVILAFWAERLYNKTQILEMYFNQVPYGGTAWGIEAAAEVYFNKHVEDLSLSESAFLAGITAAPTAYSPFGIHPDAWKWRQQEVLHRMVSLGYITEKEAAKAGAETLRFQSPQITMKAPHFVNYIKEQLIEKYGLPMVEKGGLTVITTLDLSLQEKVQTIVAEEVASASYLQVSNGATVITDPKTGEILAMVGSKDYANEDGGKVNVVTSLRQPGSSVKAITYSAALKHGMTAATILDDAPTTFAVAGGPAYSPVNYGDKYYGKIPLRFALANSLNVPAVKTVKQIGVPTMVQLGKDMGISHWKNPEDYGLSVTLGASEVTMLDMATVFGTLANMGQRIDLTPIREITNSKGDYIEQAKKLSGRRVLDESIAYIISDILADNKARSSAFGPNTPLVIPGHKVSVKTGTSDNKRDNWAVGYTNNYVVTVWVGNNDNTPMSENLASGITGATPIWNRVFTDLLTKNPEKQYARPADVTERICFGRMELFIKGTESIGGCQPFVSPSIFLQNRNANFRLNR